MQKRSISLSVNDVLDVITCVDTSIIYLENSKSRFKLLKMPFYFNSIDRGISDLLVLRNKFMKLYSKFDNTNISIKDNDITSTFFKFIADFTEGS